MNQFLLVKVCIFLNHLMWVGSYNSTVSFSLQTLLNKGLSIISLDWRRGSLDTL